MKKLILLFSLVITLTGCGQNSEHKYNFTCASKISKNEVKDFENNSFEDYSDSDIDLLAEITTFIIDSNPENESYECFFNERKKDFLVLDVYGLENEKKIDETLCKLKANKDIKLPKKTYFLFHKYVNEFEDGGILVGLSVD